MVKAHTHMDDPARGYRTRSIRWRDAPPRVFDTVLTKRPQQTGTGRHVGSLSNHRRDKIDLGTERARGLVWMTGHRSLYSPVVPYDPYGSRYDGWSYVRTKAFFAALVSVAVRSIRKRKNGE